RERAGWEQNSEAATGMMTITGDANRPALLPVPFADYTTGFLAAFGAMQALHRRAVEGGSWWVRVSLCQSNEWLHRVGALPALDHAKSVPQVELSEADSPFGRLRFIPPV